ncbi:MAG: calcineurin-like phosphoesterase C-terminal domain-containing protein [Planctomycetota bacterium]|jgi:hypothetical protein
MHRSILHAAPLGLLLIAASAAQAQDTPKPPAAVPAEPTFAEGIVFVDANRNRVFDDGEAGVEGVVVSNQHQVTRTDADGRYRLPIVGDAIVFVTKPRNYRVPLNAQRLPQFYYVHKPKGSPKLRFKGVAPTGPLPASIDFPLYPFEEPDKFRAILFGDPQPVNLREVDYITRDVLEELVGTDAAFGITLGDIVFDNLALFEPLNEAIALLDIPWYNVIGNHDINHDAPNDALSDETFERVYGPAYYSFDHGPVHFVVLDNVGHRQSAKGGLAARFGDAQLAWLARDLAEVPQDKLLILTMHIPLAGTQDRQALFRLIEKRPYSMSVSAHQHFQRHRFFGERDGWRGKQPHHHLVNVTVSGAWWKGPLDERGIPAAPGRDGSPNGYSIFTFDGHSYAIDFKAAGKPSDYQLSVFAPAVIEAGKGPHAPISVNVFGGSERSVVEMRVGAQASWQPLKRVRAKDPGYLKLREAESWLKTPKARKLPEPTPSDHLWQGPLPDNLEKGMHLIEIRTTDMFGRTHKGARAIRVR